MNGDGGSGVRWAGTWGLQRHLERIVLAQIKRGPNKCNLPELLLPGWEQGEGIIRFREDLDEFVENGFLNRILGGVKDLGRVPDA